MSFGIKLSNGHVIDFACAAGALAYDGDGWWFEQPFRWLGLIRPKELTIITKTLTYLPRKGNYLWHAPWRCVRPVGNGSVVNAFGLTNPGYIWWVKECYPRILRKGYKVIVSIAPFNMEEAYHMIYELNQLDIAGIELNPFCPNVPHDKLASSIVSFVKECAHVSKHSLGLKLGYTEPYLEICHELDGVVEFFDLINAVPWKTVYGEKRKSPLTPYNLTGAVSGLEIKKYARQALQLVKAHRIKTPVMSGGGIDSYEEAMLRINGMKANAISFGVLFNRRAWEPNMIARRIRLQSAIACPSA